MTRFASDVEAADALALTYKNLSKEISKVIIGQDEVVRFVLTGIFCQGHSLLIGVPGLAKTLLVQTIATALDLQFKRIQFTPDLMPSDIIGAETMDKERNFKFVKGPVFANIVLADEINRTPPKTQAALLESMQEYAVTIAGVRYELPKPFFVLATQNPIEQEGTYPLPEAQLDRFFFKVLSLAPGRAELAEIIERTTGGHEADIQPAIGAAALLEHQRLIRRIIVAPMIRDFAVRLVLATHPGPFATPLTTKFVRLGASPRAAQALILAGKCRALLDGRSAVSTDDLRAVALPALRHRLILNFEAHAEGVSPDSIVSNLVETLPTEAV